ncbi:acyltransferase [Chitinivorax sp. B]|uniref:acyltransferase family protein n=1 Tax=Chitinivorax sp. B TaxID=2502235 RepID=UPI0010F72928|nr:acyltransferase [Chitinivorax sp. B]
MQRMPGLDLMRAIAILWVMLFHAMVGGLSLPGNNIARFGWMGVDLFFVLSGFLIGSQLLQTLKTTGTVSCGRFYLRRAFRILPAFWVMVVLYFNLPGIREFQEIQPWWQFLTFTENLLIDYSIPKAFSHVWSLCVEEHFYLLLPVLVWAMARRPSAVNVVVVSVSIILGGLLLRWYVWQHDLAPVQGIVEGPGNFFQLYIERIYYPTYTRLDGLLAGVALAIVNVYHPKQWAWLMLRANGLLLAGVVGMACSLYLFVDRFAFLPAVIGFPLLSWSLAMLVAAAASPFSLIGRFRLPGVTVVATLAYSLYLTHKAVFHCVQVQWGNKLMANPVLAYVCYGGAALVAGGGLYWLVERPGLHLRDWLLGHAMPAAETVTTTAIMVRNP